MSARRRRVLTLSIVVIGVVMLFVRMGRRAEPGYAGKPLSFWVHQLPCTIPTGVSNGWKEVPRMKYMGQAYGSDLSSNAAVAIKVIGTNALPFLIEVLGSNDSRGKGEIAQKMREFGMNIPRAVRFSDPMRWQATTAFRILGMEGVSATESLRQLEKDKRHMNHFAAALILEGFTTNRNEQWFQPGQATNVVLIGRSL